MRLFLKEKFKKKLIEYLNKQTVRPEEGHWLYNRPIAHRGLHNELYPENSLGAFQNAILNNYAIELDVHLLKDNEVAVFHDHNLKRMVGVDKEISELTSFELKNYYLKNSNYKIPLLRDVLSEINGQTPFILEIKNPEESRRKGPLKEAIYYLIKNYEGKMAFQSFNPFFLIWFKKKLPNIPRGMLSTGDFKNIGHLNEVILKNYWLYPLVGPSFLSQNMNFLNDDVIKFLQGSCKLPLLAWTIRSKEDYVHIRRQCQNIIFENFIL